MSHLAYKTPISHSTYQCWCRSIYVINVILMMEENSDCDGAGEINNTEAESEVRSINYGRITCCVPCCDNNKINKELSFYVIPSETK